MRHLLFLLFTLSSTAWSERIAVIEIADRTDMISEKTRLRVFAELEALRKSRPDGLVLRLDTPGGEIFAAQAIGDAFFDIDAVDGIPVTAFIDSWALSAGAMLAFSCRHIIVVDGGLMGAAEPVTMTADGMKSAGEKIRSVVRTDMAQRAEHFGRSPELGRGMVDADLTEKKKLLTLGADDLVHLGVAEKKVPRGTTVETLFPLATIERYPLSPLQKALFWLHDPNVESLLMMGLSFGFYSEIQMGFGFGAVVGLLCLALLFISYSVALPLDIAGFVEKGLIWLGIGLILAALFAKLISRFLGLVLPDSVDVKEDLLAGVSVGDKGVTLSDLRPFGKVEIGGKVFEAQSEFGFIKMGQSVTVKSKQAKTLSVQ